MNPTPFYLFQFKINYFVEKLRQNSKQVGNKFLKTKSYNRHRSLPTMKELYKKKLHST